MMRIYIYDALSFGFVSKRVRCGWRRRGDRKICGCGFDCAHAGAKVKCSAEPVRYV